MISVPINLAINWKCKHTWKTSSYNTSWCLVGCSIGDLGTIAFFQFFGIPWPVWAIMSLAIFNGIMTSIMLETMILIRQMPIDKNNPCTGGQVAERIQQELDQEGYLYNQDYVIINVPNITNITYGREVGYTITKETLSKEIEDISATKIRQGQI